MESVIVTSLLFSWLAFAAFLHAALYINGIKSKICLKNVIIIDGIGFAID